MQTLMKNLDCFTRDPLHIHTIEVPFRGERREVEVYVFLEEGEGYYRSFGLQWNRYRDIQIDRFNGTQGSYNHLMMFCQGEIDILKGSTCLEIGSGAGRFTDYLVDICKRVITVDASEAIFHNVALGAPNLIACRGDLFDLPIRREKFDVVFCRGVIQHTADPKEAIRKLFSYVRQGGWVLFDVYPLKWYTPFVTKYWLRPLTVNADPEKFFSFAEKWVPKLLRFKKHVVNRILPNNKFFNHLGNQLVPIVDTTRSSESSSWEEQVERSILDTVDMYTPYYDRPTSFRSIMRHLEEVGAKHIQANPSSFCFKAIAT